jgi:phage FluMu protein Com
MNFELLEQQIKDQNKRLMTCTHCKHVWASIQYKNKLVKCPRCGGYTKGELQNGHDTVLITNKI